MLVITRKNSESFLIGDNIEIKISDIGAERVKICIDAPKEISVMRKELVETSKLNREAGTLTDSEALARLKNFLK
ncbi:MAG: carbon storage regulator [Clostridia bacterium]|nr:carbon storage regulator [Clostridia bacterium]